MIKLARFRSDSNGTFGTLSDDTGQKICYTCERPWDDNKPDTSCIPKGIYNCIPHNSSSHPDTWEITGVPNRSEILIHNGNINTQSSGCVLVGDSLGKINGMPAVLNSVSTLEMLRSVLPSNFQLTITESLA